MLIYCCCIQSSLCWAYTYLPVLNYGDTCHYLKFVHIIFHLSHCLWYEFLIENGSITSNDWVRIYLHFFPLVCQISLRGVFFNLNPLQIQHWMLFFHVTKTYCNNTYVKYVYNKYFSIRHVNFCSSREIWSLCYSWMNG